MLPQPGSAICPSVSALPLLLVAARSPDPGCIYLIALAAAVAAVDADTEPGDPRRRLALLVCELAAQYGRRTGNWSATLPISRQELAKAGGLAPFRARRALAVLEAAGAVRVRPDGLIVTDWRRLADAAQYPTAWLAFPLRQDEPAAAGFGEEPPQDHLWTRAGEPAYFE